MAMKHLNEYCKQSPLISEYLLSKEKASVAPEFPEKPIAKDIEDFLKENGFTKIETDNESAAGNIERFRETYKVGDRYLVNSKDSDGSFAIRFAANGPIDKENPVWFVKVSDDGDLNKIWGAGFSEVGWEQEYSNDTKFYSDFESLRKAIIKRFKWS